MRRVNTGFTLIEFMIVIAVVGMLAVIAVPAYLQYTRRAAVGELLLATAPLETDAGEYVSTRGTLPDPNLATIAPGPFVARAEWKASTGRIEVIPSTEVIGDGPAFVLWLEPRFMSDGGVGWRCGCDGDGCALVPSTCRVAVAANGNGNQ